MNPRKRRAISRAIMAGMPKSKLNSENIRKFLLREKEKGSLNLTEDCINDILFPKGFLNKPTKNIIKEEVEEVETNDVVNTTSTDDVEVEEADIDDENEETTFVNFSTQNSKAELQRECDRLEVEYKKGFSKSKLLELINDH